MRKSLKSKLLALTLAVCITFSGCSLSMSVDELMRPPRLTEEQENIYNALLECNGNSSVKLKYPKNGDYKSAFVMYDIDSDSEQEAIVFYDALNPASTTTEAVVSVTAFDMIDDEWKAVYTYQYNCSDINMIDFIHSADGSVYIAIGYVTGLSEKVLGVYKYTYENGLSQVYQANYTMFYVCDVNFDGNDEMMLFNNNPVSMTSNLQVLQTGDNFETASTVEMQPGINEISEIVTTNINGKFVMYIDAVNTQNMLITDVIEFENGNARNLTYTPPGETQNESGIQTLRQVGIYSCDIDSDGEIEVPYSSVLPGYENEEKENQKSAVQWQTIKDDRLQRKYYSYYNLNEGYLFVFPERWVGLVTVRTDGGTNETVFVKYGETDISKMPELLRVKVVETGTGLPSAYENYQFVSSDSEHDFYIKLSDDSNEKLVLTSTEAAYGLYTIKK